jgi:diguanylate cyclase (GGDEF)-like protein
MTLGNLHKFRILMCWLALAMAAQAQQYVFRVFRQPEGLKNLAVHAMTVDRSGYLWQATENGVFRFLGSGFERYGVEEGISELVVMDILADDGGNLWAATRTNLYRWDGTRFRPAGREAIPLAESGDLASEDEHHLLVVSKGRLYRLQTDVNGSLVSFLPVFTERMVAALPELAHLGRVSVTGIEKGRKTIWLGGRTRLLALREERLGRPMEPGDGAVTVWGAAQGLPAERWDAVLQDHAGMLWAAGQNHIAVLPRGAGKFMDRSIPGSDLESTNGHSPMVEDHEGRIVAPTEDGVARWEGDHWRRIGKSNGLTHIPIVSSLVFDAAGDLWIGSMGGGIYDWLGYSAWEGWGDEQKLPSPAIWALAPVPNGRMVVGTEHGLGWVEPRSGDSGTLDQGVRTAMGQVGALMLGADGKGWGGTFLGGILRVDAKAGRVDKVASVPDTIYSVIEDRQGSVYFSTHHGVWVSEKGAPPQRVAAATALLGDGDRVDVAAVGRDGTLWFLANNRLLRLRNGVWSLAPVDGLNVHRDRLFAMSVAPDGALWLTGQLSGTWRLQTQGDRLLATELKLPKEYSSLAPLSIYVDERGWVWLGSDQGILVWNGSAWRHLNQESGLIWNDANQGALLGGPDGSLWVGTSGGLAHLLHPERIFDPVPLSASLVWVQRGRQSFSLGQDLTLPWSAQALEFQFASPTFRNRSELIFRYKLEGMQTEWSEDADGKISFPALPPGEYNLLAVAFNPGLNAFSQPIRVHLKILAPWWRSWWFFTLCVLLLAALLFALFRLRERQLREKSRQLERLVSERTRELEFSREQLRVQATHDGLTGMLNRRGILQAVTREMERGRRENRALIVALVDLDHFKRINDTFGHLAGDEALRWFAASVGAAVRTYDHAGRYGGEEFLIALTQVPADAAEQRLAGLHATISNLQVHTRESEFKMNCSIGAAVIDSAAGYGSIEAVLAVADQALYEAKAAGRNRVVLRRINPADPLPV